MFYKKIFTSLLMMFLFCICTTSSFGSTIKEELNSYLVNNVIVRDASFDNEQSTKQIALSHAKQLAFSEILQYIKEQDVSYDEVNIDAIISSYTIVEEYYDKDFYALTANFVFNKQALQNLIENFKKKIEDDDIGSFIVKLSEKNNIIDEYVKLKDFLKKEEIKFQPREIKNKEVIILIKDVSKNKIYNSLKKLNLNGKFYIN